MANLKADFLSVLQAANRARAGSQQREAGSLANELRRLQIENAELKQERLQAQDPILPTPFEDISFEERLRATGAPQRQEKTEKSLMERLAERIPTKESFSAPEVAQVTSVPGIPGAFPRERTLAEPDPLDISRPTPARTKAELVKEVIPTLDRAQRLRFAGVPSAGKAKPIKLTAGTRLVTPEGKLITEFAKKDTPKQSEIIGRILEQVERSGVESLKGGQAVIWNNIIKKKDGLNLEFGDDGKLRSVSLGGKPPAVEKETVSVKGARQKASRDARNRLGALEKLRDNFDENLFTLLGSAKVGTAKALDKAFGPANVPPGFKKALIAKTQFVTNLKTEFIKFKKWATGVAASDKEMAEIRASFPDVNASPTELLTQIRTVIATTTRLIKESEERGFPKLSKERIQRNRDIFDGKITIGPQEVTRVIPQPLASGVIDLEEFVN